MYVIIIFSFLIGPFGAITSTDVYQFFAYISVTQLGWLLIGLIVYQEKNAVTLYYFYYFLISSILVLIITNDFNPKLETNTLINFVNKKREIRTDLLLILVLMTLTGLPPTAGFLPKFYILLVAYLEGYWILAILAIFSSIFSGYYYIRISYLLFIKLKESNMKNIIYRIDFD